VSTNLPPVPQVASPEMLVAFREGFECWNRGEIDLMADSYDPDATVDMSRVLPDESVLHGVEAIRPFFHRLWDAWEGVRYDPEEIFELGEDRFLVATRVWGRGRASGIEIDQRQGFLYTLGPSGIASLVMYPSTEEALAAVASQTGVPDQQPPSRSV
jgi:ketosteroid isomerase-like protein